MKRPAVDRAGEEGKGSWATYWISMEKGSRQGPWTCWGSSRRAGGAGKVVHVRRECREEGEQVGTQKWDKVYLTLKLFKTSEKLFSSHTCTVYYFEEGKVLPMLI